MAPAGSGRSTGSSARLLWRGVSGVSRGCCTARQRRRQIRALAHYPCSSCTARQASPSAARLSCCAGSERVRSRPSREPPSATRAARQSPRGGSVPGVSRRWCMTRHRRRHIRALAHRAHSSCTARHASLRGAQLARCAPSKDAIAPAPSPLRCQMPGRRQPWLRALKAPAGRVTTARPSTAKQQNSKTANAGTRRQPRRAPASPATTPRPPRRRGRT